MAPSDPGGGNKHRHQGGGEERRPGDDQPAQYSRADGNARHRLVKRHVGQRLGKSAVPHLHLFTVLAAKGGSNADLRREWITALAQKHGAGVEDALLSRGFQPLTHLPENHQPGRKQRHAALADDFVGRVAENSFRAAVVGQNPPLQIAGDDAPQWLTRHRAYALF